MQYLHLIPKYVAALKSARNQIAAARNLEEMKKKVQNSEPTDTESEDLPANTKKKSS
jgi:hypothetical protein